MTHPGISMFAVSLASLFLAACGHNSVQYGDGLGFETTLNPETFNFGINLRYGKILSACIKENAKVSLSTDVVQSGETASSSGGGNELGTKTVLSLETGGQVTGYAVELEEAKRKIAEPIE